MNILTYTDGECDIILYKSNLLEKTSEKEKVNTAGDEDELNSLS